MIIIAGTIIYLRVRYCCLTPNEQFSTILWRDEIAFDEMMKTSLYQISNTLIVSVTSKWFNPYTDVKPFIMKYILKNRQDSREQQIHSKLHEIHSLVGKIPCFYCQNHKEQVILTRCRIGHSRFTHNYLMRNDCVIPIIR